MEVIRIDDNTFTVTKDDGTVNEYKYSFLSGQEASITESRNKEIAAVEANRDREIAEVHDLLALAASVNIPPVVVEPEPKPEVTPEEPVVE